MGHVCSFLMVVETIMYYGIENNIFIENIPFSKHFLYICKILNIINKVEKLIQYLAIIPIILS